MQRSSRGSDGVCWCNQQTEHPWSTCQKAPSVAVTRGWGSYIITADLETTPQQHNELRNVLMDITGELQISNVFLFSLVKKKNVAACGLCAYVYPIVFYWFYLLFQRIAAPCARRVT